jgi:hypothetical protein
VDTAQPPIDNDAEQQWIAKYRNAIEATAPTRLSRTVMARRWVLCLLKAAASNLQRILASRMHAASLRLAPQPRLKMAPVGTLVSQNGMSETRKWGSNVLPKKAG